jgi:hypothetical protein
VGPKPDVSSGKTPIFSRTVCIFGDTQQEHSYTSFSDTSPACQPDSPGPHESVRGFQGRTPGFRGRTLPQDSVVSEGGALTGSRDFGRPLPTPLPLPLGRPGGRRGPKLRPLASGPTGRSLTFRVG